MQVNNNRTITYNVDIDRIVSSFGVLLERYVALLLQFSCDTCYIYEFRGAAHCRYQSSRTWRLGVKRIIRRDLPLEIAPTPPFGGADPLRLPVEGGALEMFHLKRRGGGVLSGRVHSPRRRQSLQSTPSSARRVRMVSLLPSRPRARLPGRVLSEHHSTEPFLLTTPPNRSS
jgi:hypothetical protein